MNLSSSTLIRLRSQISYEKPVYEEIRETQINNESLFLKNATNNLSQRKRKKVVYGSPIWFRDCTKRLQRKPIRKSTSFESGLSNISGPEPVITYENGTDFKSIHFNTSSLQAIDYRCMEQSENDLLSARNHVGFFNSTMINGSENSDYGRKETRNTIPLRGAQLSKESYGRNHTGKLKISNSWIDWTPFWIRDNSSKRLDRRHYISDFFINL